VPELRQDPTTKDWVVIARERAKRPEQFKRSPSPPAEAPANCPFCPGNEHLTPPTIAELRDDRAWKVRVVANKFSAFEPEVIRHPHEHNLFNSQDAYGHHEVVIETPEHQTSLGEMGIFAVRDVLRTYRERHLALRQDPKVRLVLAFRNHGLSAGASLAHPHSQVVGTPIIPPRIRGKYEVAIRYFDDTQGCIYCAVRDGELKDGRRLILDTRFLTAVHPFASQVPFETWIIPKRHNPSFAEIVDRELDDLAFAVRSILGAMHGCLGNPDYNLIVHTAPVEDEHKPYFLWHVEIRPRLATPAGFELGTGVFINTAVPEETAAYFRPLVEHELRGLSTEATDGAAAV
jgi:UDPglucose--hexose-1-phosphate uridylyltransferase